MRRPAYAVLGASLYLASSNCFALPASGARDYANAPQGFTGLQYVYQHVDTNAEFDLPIVDPGLSMGIDLHTVRYLKYFGRNGHTSAFSIYQAYGDLDGTFTPFGGGRTIRLSGHGYSDTVVILGTNLSGAPYLPLNEYMQWSFGPTVTAQVMISAPTGSYSRNKLFNMGTNRWQVKPELAYLMPVGEKGWWDVYGNVEWFQDNDDPRGGNRLETKPLFGLDTHYSYTFNRAFWAGVGVSYRRGGATRLDGISQGGSEEYTDGVAAASMTFSPNWMAKAMYSHPIKASNEDVNTEIFQLTIQYNWGHLPSGR